MKITHVAIDLFIVNIGQMIHNALFGKAFFVTDDTFSMNPDVVKENIVFNVANKVTATTLGCMNTGLKCCSS